MDISRYCASTFTFIEKLRMRYCIASFFDWKCTPTLRRDKNRDKASHGAGKFSKKLCNSKKSSYNERNCKSGRHNRRHSFLRHKLSKTCQDANTTSLLALKVKTRSVGGTKYPSPRRRDRMIWAIHRRQVREQLYLSNWASIYCHMMSPIYIMIL